MKKHRSLFLPILLICAAFLLHGFTTSPTPAAAPAPANKGWAEKKLASMTLEEKIAQLIFIRIHSNKNEAYYQNMVKEIEQFQPGGVCFFQGGPKREISLTNRIQAVSKIPLLVSMDAEWGPSMRLDSCTIFPRFLTLGALPEKDKKLIYKMGQAIGEQCSAVGVHVNYAPVVDVNNNKNNPVINSRSFGENREKVTEYASLFLNGMQKAGVIGCLKHFPGHGDTEVDSHHGLPVINKTKEELEEMELYPYRKMINKEDVEMIMVSHLNIPALDPAPNSIATLSQPILSDLLRNDMKFDGILITDGMEMAGLRKHFPNGADAEIRTLKAGMDVLLLPNQLKVIMPLLVEAVKNGTLSEAEIDAKCLRVLKLKQKLNLKFAKPLTTNNVYEELNHSNTEHLIKTIEEKAITLVKNDSILPLKSADKTCLVFIGDPENEDFTKKIAQEYQLPFVKINENIVREGTATNMMKVSAYDNLIVIYLSMNQSPARGYGIHRTAVDFLGQVSKNKNVILTTLGNPYGLEQFRSLDTYRAVIVGYQRTENSTRAVVSGIFGGHYFGGQLPVSVLNYKSGHGLTTKKKDNTLGIAVEKQKEIETMVNNGIANKVFPGCQLIASKNGEIIYKNEFGYTNYEKTDKVTENTMYDIASITKSLATTLAMMKLYEEGKYKLKDPISKYVTYTKGTNKGNFTIDELLTHTTGMKAYIPFYQELNTDSLRYYYLNNIPTENHSTKIADNLYIRPEFIALMREEILGSEVKTNRYIYSDLNFFFLKEMIEAITKQPLEEYLCEQFYYPMNLYHTAINPLEHDFSPTDIAPTENDTLFRMQTVQGYVHDQTSACIGGFAGNAGLFSTTSDLLCIIEMLNNGGVYKGRKYLKEETVALFTKPYPINNCTRRTLGFYAPKAEGQTQILPQQASNLTYGHQGFTGTVFWVDPVSDLIYIFLSNRVHPHTEPNNLVKSKLRLTLHEKIYESIQ